MNCQRHIQISHQAWSYSFGLPLGASASWLFDTRMGVSYGVSKVTADAKHAQNYTNPGEVLNT